MIETAVVILNWNGLSFLQKFLKNIIEKTEDKNTAVYIIDNASTDTSISYITETYPHIPIIQLDKNYGFAGGYNKGLENIEAEFYILLNSDIEVTENWTKPLIKALKNDLKIAACMPKIKSYFEKEYFEYAGAAGGFIDKFGYPYCNGRLFNHREKDIGQYESQSNIFWASGAAMCIRSSTFKEIQGFDEDFFAHMEEIDVCWRLKNRGYTIQYVPSSTIYHIGGGTLPKENPFKTYLNFRNNLFLLYKNLTHEKLRTTLFIRRILDIIAYLSFVAKLDLKNAQAIISAHRDFTKAIPSLKQKRIELEKNRKISKHPEVYSKSIILQAFVCRKKKIVL
ncbi:MAG: glycosyltransferase family 2 protein [Bacteroidota bacterium]